MHRFVTLAILVLFTIPFGVSISGCSKASTVSYCNGSAGLQLGQTAVINLEPRLTGISLNQGQIGSIGAPQGKDCRGDSSSTLGVLYGSSDRTLVDVNPGAGSGGLCAGTWNRNSGGGVADYTVCTPNGREGTAFITASAQAVTSNPVSIYVHPIVTSVVLGSPSTNCSSDPASNCTFDPVQGNGCSATPPSPVAGYDGTACLSQGAAAQFTARIFSGTGTSQRNISCLVGPINFTAQNASVVTINTNGLATAAQPGSTIISASIDQSSSSAGSFSTCPPANIVLTTPPQTAPPTAPVNVNQNFNQVLTATVTDKNGVALNNIALEYVSTTPITIPTAGNSVTPTYPGAAAITALCQPPTCNGAPFNEIGLFGTGTPIASNSVQVNATGTNNATVLYIASTQSQYLLPIDFTVPTQPSAVRLPYVPNSLVLSEDGASIYMGSSYELMVYNTLSNSLTRQDTFVPGNVLAVSPDNATVVITDPTRSVTYLYSSTGTVLSQYGGIATRAQWTPDSSTVYITTTDGRMLVHSTFTGWTSVNLTTTASDVAVTVPNAGVYLGGSPVDVRTNCPATTVTGSGVTQTTSNVFYPDLGPVAGATADRVVATNDGVHILGASITGITDIATNKKSGACPVTFTSTPAAIRAYAGVVPTNIRSLFPTSDSAYAFVTYQGTGGVVPQYAPGTGVLTNVPLQKTAAGTPVDAISGVVSSDNNTLFIGTEGDNLVHRLTRGASGFTDTLTPIIPALPLFNGTGNATPDLLAQKPRKATS